MLAITILSFYSGYKELYFDPIFQYILTLVGLSHIDTLPCIFCYNIPEMTSSIQTGQIQYQLLFLGQ